MNRVAVVTGASSGIGAATAKRLRELGWDVAVVGRNPERTRKVAAEIGGTPFLADYDSLDEVRQLGAALLDRFDRIDVLVNNAGGVVHDRGDSRDGFERTLQHNHLAPFLLTDILFPALLAGSARVIGTGSVANLWGDPRLDDLDWRKRPWLGGWRAYGSAKVLTILFMRELAARSGIGAYSVHPGYVSTSFGASAPIVRLATAIRPSGFGLSAEDGAAPLVQLASAESVNAPNGSYFERFRPGGRLSRAARDDRLGKAAWERSAELVGAANLGSLDPSAPQRGL